MKIKIAAAALALVGLAGSMHAQASLNDLVIGFEDTSASYNLEVDLGNATSYLSLGAGTYTVGNLNTDLTGIFGSWTGDSSLTFGIVGAQSGSTSGGVFKDTLWASNNGSGNYSASSSATQSTPSGKIQGLYGLTGAVGSFGNLTVNDTSLTDINSQTNAATGANLVGNKVTAGEVGSFASVQGANNFGIPGAASNLFVAGNVGSGSAIASLYEIQPTNSTTPPDVVDLGYFTLSSTGALTFTVIPEPSTYAAILGAVSIGFALLRRRSKQVLA
jgi:hypothetical protein